MRVIIKNIGYIIILAISAFLYYFLHSHFYFLVLVILLTAPIISIIGAVLLRKNMAVQIENLMGQSPIITEGEESIFKITIRNKTIFPTLDARVKLTLRNTFFETEASQVIVAPIYWKFGKQSTIILPIKTTLPGKVQVKVEEINMMDLMGFIRLKRKFKNDDIYSEISVMPNLKKLNESIASTVNVGTVESEESSKRGNDFSDVHDIREYIPGDKLMSIHWKLSAKRDILMVKDRVSMSDSQVVIVPELLAGNIPRLGIIIANTYNVINELIKENVAIKLLYWSSAKYEYEAYKIDTKEDAKEAFSRMFYEKTYESDIEAASHMPLVYPEIKSYVHINASSSEMLTIKENA